MKNFRCFLKWECIILIHPLSFHRGETLVNKIIQLLKNKKNFFFKNYFGYIIVSSKTFDLSSYVLEVETRLKDTEVKLQDTEVKLQDAGINFYHTKKREEILSLFCKEKVKPDLKNFCAENLFNSKSQLLQDLVAAYLGNTGGFFCEIGAADGVKLSNTYMLEKNYGWSGIIVEPARCYTTTIKDNRKCFISDRAVYGTSKSLIPFNETIDPLLSTIAKYSQSDMHRESRENGVIYEVETITLYDLLKEGSAPSFIDYLSIDTEGSEYEILKNFDFDVYSFGFISIEHNYSSTREKVFEILTKNGYHRVMDAASLWDDFYVSDNLVSRIFG